MATTSYGTWVNHGDGGATLKDGVIGSLGEHFDGYDVDGLTDAFRDAINDQLPDGVSLHGDEFYGPYPIVDGEVMRGQINEAIQSVDFFMLADRFENGSRCSGECSGAGEGCRC
jgi:hypothetical protein